MKRAPLISRDFEETKRAPLKFQIFRKINETRTPKFGPGGVVKGGASNIYCTVSGFDS